MIIYGWSIVTTKKENPKEYKKGKRIRYSVCRESQNFKIAELSNSNNDNIGTKLMELWSQKQVCKDVEKTTSRC